MGKGSANSKTLKPAWRPIPWVANPDTDMISDQLRDYVNQGKLYRHNPYVARLPSMLLPVVVFIFAAPTPQVYPIPEDDE